jgi:hypothetical protein
MKTINFLLPIFIFTFGLSHAQQTQESNSTLDSSSETSIVLDSVPDTYNIKRFSLGLKAGVPNIVSVGAQYTLPFLNNHLAPYFEYSSYSHDDGEIEGDLSFSEFGAAYYFNTKGKGFYLGVGLSSLKIKASYNDVSLDEGRTGSGSTDIALNTTNFKIGLKTGGTIYFRLELGYGMGSLPQTVDFTATDNSNPSYTEIVTEDIPEIPGISENGLIIGNIGFGVSF